MIRLAWRQARLPAVTTAVLLAVLATVLVLSWRAATHYEDTSGLLDCVNARGDCANQLSEFEGHYFQFLALPPIAVRGRKRLRLPTRRMIPAASPGCATATARCSRAPG